MWMMVHSNVTIIVTMVEMMMMLGGWYEEWGCISGRREQVPNKRSMKWKYASSPFLFHCNAMQSTAMCAPCIAKNRIKWGFQCNANGHCIVCHVCTLQQTAMDPVAQMWYGLLYNVALICGAGSYSRKLNPREVPFLPSNPSLHSLTSTTSLPLSYGSIWCHPPSAFSYILALYTYPARRSIHPPIQPN